MFAATSSVASAPPPLVRRPSAAAISARNLFIGAIIAAFAIVFLLGFWVGRATKPEVHDDAEYVLGELKAGASAAWSNIVSFSGVVTQKAADSLEVAAAASSEALLKFLQITEEQLKSILMIIGNLGFCVLVTLGFMYLPSDAMLIVSLVTILVGPAFILFILRILGGLLYIAANAPILYVLGLFIVALLRSKLWQWIGMRLGWDKDGDGQVSLRDAIIWLRSADWYIRFKEGLVGRGWVRLGAIDEIEELIAPIDGSRGAGSNQ